jgi:hypothetical protein
MAENNGVTTPDANDVITRAQAVDIIAHLVKQEHEEIRLVKDRVAKRITRAPPAALPRHGKHGFVFAELIGWAMRFAEWAPHLAHLPARCSLSLSVLLPSLSVSGAGISLPNNIPDCHARIRALEKEVGRLSAVEQECRTLRAQAEARAAGRRKMSDGGKRGGRGHER